MVHITEDQALKLTGKLPPSTLEYLRDTGVPEVIVHCGNACRFDLSLEPHCNGYFRVGVESNFGNFLGLEPATGHFAWMGSADEQDSVLMNTSLEHFVRCSAALDELWRLEETKAIPWETRGQYLEDKLKEIDPMAVADPEGPWMELVWELKSGVV